MTLKKYSSLGANRFFWFNILAMCVVAFLLILSIFKGLDVYTHHGEEVIVPDVKGMMPNQADKLFLDKGLVAKVVSTSYQKNMPSGCILELTPEPGEKVKKGRIIFLTINSINAPLREVPDVTENSSAREAEAQLLTAGFHLTPNKLVNGELDWVYGVLYNGRRIMTGEKIPIGSILTLEIGNGNVEMDNTNQDSVSLDEGEVGLGETPTVSEPNKPETKPSKQQESTPGKTKSNSQSSKTNIKPKANNAQAKPAQKTKAKHKNENSNESWF